jgi:hypothetical protein
MDLLVYQQFSQLFRQSQLLDCPTSYVLWCPSLHICRQHCHFMRLIIVKW